MTSGTGPGPRRPRRVLPLVLAALVGGAVVWFFLSVADQPAGSAGRRVPDTRPSSSSAPASPAGTTDAVVERVVDGDTVIVRLDGERLRVRLLNIDTPETVAEDRPVECLGPEASAFTKTLLPAGARVRLGFDVERTDQYDRTLAAVFTEDGENVSVELARRGLGTAVYYGDNARYLDDVQAAEAEARDDRVGLFDPDLECAS
jgi:micrococcal nuclease